MDSIRQQFSDIYDQYIQKIYRFVYLKVESQEVAEDISSKVFLRGWESFQNPKERIVNPGAFLYQIARNMVVDHYRQKNKRATVPQDHAHPIADTVNIHENAVLKEDMEGIKKVLLGLKKDYQDVLIWHYLDDMPIAKIAEVLEKPEGTVRVMLHRGLKSLKNELIQKS
jgi:RNA polymerase sigma-70 factor (ECF subfamily)